MQPSICTRVRFRGLTSPFGVVSHCPYHCRARVAQGIRAILTYRCLHLPPGYPGSPHSVLDPSKEVASKYERRSCSLLDLTRHFTARTDDGHAASLGSSGKTFNLTFILPSLLVRCPVYCQIEPHASLLVVRPRLFLKVSVLRPYFPGGRLNAFAPALHTHEEYATHSLQCLQLGLQGSLATLLVKFSFQEKLYLIPFAPPAFVPDRRTRSRQMPSLLVVHQGL